MKTMHKTGGVGILHRFMPHDKLISIVKNMKVNSLVNPLVISVGVQKEDRELVMRLLDLEKTPDAYLIDIAHADSVHAHEMLQWMKKIVNGDVIFGNIATREAAVRACDLGADGLRAGIGGGGQCATRQVTGFGLPSLQSIIDIASVGEQYQIPIMADGGIRASGDMVKLLAFGADTVCVGGLLAGTSDSPTNIIEKNGKQYKKHFGSASKEAQEQLRDGLKRGTAPEGLSTLIEYTGETEEVILELTGGIRSGLTYAGASNIKELRENAQYVILTGAGSKESKL
jgi:IMP dehydrogenase